LAQRRYSRTATSRSWLDCYPPQEDQQTAEPHHNFRSRLICASFTTAAANVRAAILAWQPEVRGRRVLRLVVVLWDATAFGAIHTIVEYVVVINFSDANWDAPPGTGYLTVATITISAILTVIMTRREPRTLSPRWTLVQGRSPSPEPPSVFRPGIGVFRVAPVIGQCQALHL
jgi:hypothetical protein